MSKTRPWPWQTMFQHATTPEPWAKGVGDRIELRFGHARLCNAASFTGWILDRCAREAHSGTTPPTSACRAWLATTLPTRAAHE